MSTRKVLVIMSIDDEDSVLLAGRITRLFQFLAYEFDFFYPVTEQEYEESGTFAVPYHGLLAALDNKVRSFLPDTIILHLGAAFFANPASYLQALAVIKDRYPNIELKYEETGPPEQLEERRERFDAFRYRWTRMDDYALIWWLLDQNSLFDGSDHEVLGRWTE